jgi:hypothetical protein
MEDKMSVKESEALFTLDSIVRKVGTEVPEAQVKGIQGSISVRKPTDSEFVRAHQDENQTIVGATVLVPDGTQSKEVYLLTDGYTLPPDISNLEKIVNFYRSINHAGVEFLWLLKTTPNPWNESAREAVVQARDQWIKLRSNTGANCYDTYFPLGQLPDPEWSGRSFLEFVKLAFRGRMISSSEHKVIRMLQGA